MKKVKKTAEYTIFQRNDGRYAVKDAAKNWVNGDSKVEILKKEKLMKAPEPKPAAEEAAADAEAEKAATDGEATGE